MPREQIEFTIRPDGTVEERPLGFAGGACEEVTAGVEQALGEIVSREATMERYTDPAPTAQTQRTDESSR